MEKVSATLRLRMSYKDAHYGGNLVDGAHMVHLFGDLATELLIKVDGDEGLFLRYDEENNQQKNKNGCRILRSHFLFFCTDFNISA